MLIAALLATPTSEVIDVNGRNVTAVIPECAQSAAAGSVPLVVSLHAWGSTSASQQRVDRFADFTNAQKCFAFAYPEGEERAWGPFGVSGFAWNAGGCCPKASDDKVNDVSFAGDLVTAFRARYASLHPSQLFIAGVSNGGMFATRLGCELEGVTAVASVAGPLVNGTAELGEYVRCARAPPLMHVHGLRDPVVPFGGCNATWSSFGRECQEQSRA